jgi:hypothetical protein
MMCVPPPPIALLIGQCMPDTTPLVVSINDQHLRRVGRRASDNVVESQLGCELINPVRWAIVRALVR